MLAKESPILEKAVNTLVYVSADEQLRYELDMREKAELDYWSDIKTNYREGMEAGLAKGLEEGLAKGMEEGEKNQAIAIARNALQMGMPTCDIIKLTRLTSTEVEILKNMV